MAETRLHGLEVSSFGRAEVVVDAVRKACGRAVGGDGGVATVALVEPVYRCSVVCGTRMAAVVADTVRTQDVVKGAKPRYPFSALLAATAVGSCERVVFLVADVNRRYNKSVVVGNKVCQVAGSGDRVLRALVVFYVAAALIDQPVRTTFVGLARDLARRVGSVLLSLSSEVVTVTVSLVPSSKRLYNFCSARINGRRNIIRQLRIIISISTIRMASF